jgi:hypothetical protein
VGGGVLTEHHFFKTLVCHQARKKILGIINVFVILSQEMIYFANLIFDCFRKSTTYDFLKADGLWLVLQN